MPRTVVGATTAPSANAAGQESAFLLPNIRVTREGGTMAGKDGGGSGDLKRELIKKIIGLEWLKG